jgi:hypothetical protein
MSELQMSETVMSNAGEGHFGVFGHFSFTHMGLRSYGLVGKVAGSN